MHLARDARENLQSLPLAWDDGRGTELKLLSGASVPHLSAPRTSLHKSEVLKSMFACFRAAIEVYLWSWILYVLVLMGYVTRYL